MNINRHNYEEFFILYMDNELSADQKKEVEAFVQLHPDLKEELDSLLQYKLVPDESIVFTAKEELLKGEEKIPLTNYRETLLLYIDGELSPAQKESLEDLVSSNETLKNELEKLMQARVQPELISFPDKSLLYRRTERRIPAVWWRMAAAVLILGIILSSVLLINRKSSITPPVANRTDEQMNKEQMNRGTIEQRNIRTEEQMNKGTIEQRNIRTEEEMNKELRNEKVKQTQLTSVKESIAPKQDLVAIKNQEIKIPAEVVLPKNNETIADNNNIKPSNNLPQPQKDALAVTSMKEENKDPNALTEAGVTKPIDNSSIIQTGGTDQGFAQDGKDGKKSKLRGFFRKITRTFEKRTNIDPTTDDNKLLVAGLSINLK